jgi:hypothetical protein
MQVKPLLTEKEQEAIWRSLPLNAKQRIRLCQLLAIPEVKRESRRPNSPCPMHPAPQAEGRDEKSEAKEAILEEKRGNQSD